MKQMFIEFRLFFKNENSMKFPQKSKNGTIF